MKRIVLSAILVGVLSAANAEVRGIEFEGKKITIDQIKEKTKNYFKTDYDYLGEEQKAEILERIVEMEVVLAEAKDLKMHRTKKYVDTVNTLKDMVLMDSYSERIYKSLEVTDEDLQTYYKSNKTKFEKQDLRNASHILVKSEKQAEEIIAKLESSENAIKDFESLAKEVSIGPSSKNAGNLGWFGRNQMVPEFEEVVFKLKKGEFAKKPVKTQFGYHVIILQDAKTTPGITFKEFSETLRATPKELEKFKLELFKKKMAENVKDLREKKYKIKIIK